MKENSFLQTTQFQSQMQTVDNNISFVPEPDLVAACDFDIISNVLNNIVDQVCLLSGEESCHFTNNDKRELFPDLEKEPSSSILKQLLLSNDIQTNSKIGQILIKPANNNNMYNNSYIKNGGGSNNNRGQGLRFRGKKRGG